MAKYSVITSNPDKATPVVVWDYELPSDPEIGDEYWVDGFQSILIWTGNSWQRLYTPPTAAEPGQELFTSSSSTFTWTVPSGITSCSIVCVGEGGTGAYITVAQPTIGIWGGGGGALSYINNVSVTAGEEIIIDFPERDTGYTGQNVRTSRSSRVSRSDNTVICFAEAGGPAVAGRASEGIGDNTYSGGTPTRFNRSSASTTTTRYFAAGGGSASFGNTAGRGASGAYSTSASPDAGGGGTGLQGTTLPSSGQSFGEGVYGGNDSNFTSAGSYGGGGGVLEQYYGSGFPQIFYGSKGTGAVRIIYGDSRSFPADAEDV